MAELYHKSINKNDAFKNKTNKILMEYALKIPNSIKENSNALLLDTSNFNSTNVLIKSGYKPSSIYVIENNKEEYKKMKAKNIGVNIIFGELYQFIINTDLTFSLVYIDAFSTFTGRCFIGKIFDDTPLGMLSNIIHKITEEAIIAITLCRRKRGARKNKSVNLSKDKLDNAVIDIARLLLSDIKYSIIGHVRPYLYGGRNRSRMKFICFKVKYNLIEI